MLILARRPRAVLGVRDSSRGACAVLLRVVVWCALEEPESRRVRGGPCNKLGPRAAFHYPREHFRFTSPALVRSLLTVLPHALSFRALRIMATGRPLRRALANHARHV